jgi:hypothetical protein
MRSRRRRSPDRQFMIKGFGWSQADVDKYVKRRQGDRHLPRSEGPHPASCSCSPMTQGMFRRLGHVGHVLRTAARASGLRHGRERQHVRRPGRGFSTTRRSRGRRRRASEIKVQSGTVKGHQQDRAHKTGEQQLWQVLDELKGRGVSLSGVEVSTSTRHGVVSPGGAAHSSAGLQDGNGARDRQIRTSTARRCAPGPEGHGARAGFASFEVDVAPLAWRVHVWVRGARARCSRRCSRPRCPLSGAPRWRCFTTGPTSVCRSGTSS